METPHNPRRVNVQIKRRSGLDQEAVWTGVAKAVGTLINVQFQINFNLEHLDSAQEDINYS